MPKLAAIDGALKTDRQHLHGVRRPDQAENDEQTLLESADTGHSQAVFNCNW